MALVSSHTTSLITFHRGRGYQYMMIDIDFWSSVILSSVNEPLEDGNEQPNAKCNDAIIHVRTSDWKLWWEQEQNSSDDDIYDAQEVREPSNRRW